MDEGMMASPGNRRRVQVRKVREGGFTEAKRQVFLDHLAGCCNVTRAAKAAGVSVNTINYHRRGDPVFARQMAEALEAGYFALEAMTVEEAAGGGHYVPGPDADKAPGPQGMNIDVALRLLSMRKAPLGHRTGRAGYEPRRAGEKELNEAILAKLDVLDRRLTLRRAQDRQGGKRRADGPSVNKRGRRIPSPQPSSGEHRPTMFRSCGGHDRPDDPRTGEGALLLGR